MKKLTKFIICILCLFGMHSTAQAQSTETESVSSTSESSGIFSNFFSKEKWGVSYLSYLNGPTFSNANGGSINHYLTLKHKFSKDWSLGATIRPNSNIGNGANPFDLGDSYLKLSYPTIFKNNKVTVSGQVTYYVPMSESSKRAKLIGKISPKFYTSTSFGKLGLTYVLIPTVYLNSVKKDGQRLASHGHWFSSSYNLSDRFSLDFSVYPSWTYYRGESVAFNDVPIYPGLSMKVTEALSVSTYLEIILGDPRANSTSAGASVSYTLL